MPPADLSTLADLPFHVSGRFPKPVLVRRCHAEGFQDLSSREFFDQVRDVSLGLGALGLQPGERVAIVAETRPEWVIADLAILTAGAVTVPIYPTLAQSQVRYILSDSGSRFAIVSTDAQAAKIQEVWHEVPALQAMAVMASAGAASGARPEVLPLSDVAARGHARLTTENGLGRRYREASGAVQPDQLATIIYTSGTTGEPKGVMLTHDNIVSNIRDTEGVLGLSQDDVALSFLPLSHSFERMVVYSYLYSGVTIAFAESLDTIGRDMVSVQPTVMTGVPRVYEKLHARIVDNIAKAPALRQRIFRWALRVGLARVRAQLAGRRVSPLVALQDTLADRLVFSKIRERTGGRLRYVVSGSAPLSTAIAEFLFAVGLPVIEGYGLTETSPVLTVNPRHAPRLGTVGQAIPHVELRIADDGEILARGPNVMAGYHGKPDATAQVLQNGWFHTGDVGHLDADGYLTITDRKKELIVTSGGKNIAPQLIEGLLKDNPLVGEVVLIGDRRKFLSALIVPNFPVLEARVGALGEPPGTREELTQRPPVLRLYQDLLDAANQRLAQFEQIKRFTLLPVEFTIAGGELTPTMKVKRRVVEERWRDAVEKMYC